MSYTLYTLYTCVHQHHQQVKIIEVYIVCGIGWRMRMSTVMIVYCMHSVLAECVRSRVLYRVHVHCNVREYTRSYGSTSFFVAAESILSQICAKKNSNYDPPALV